METTNNTNNNVFNTDICNAKFTSNIINKSTYKLPKNIN